MMPLLPPSVLPIDLFLRYVTPVLHHHIDIALHHSPVLCLEDMLTPFLLLLATLMYRLQTMLLSVLSSAGTVRTQITFHDLHAPKFLLTNIPATLHSFLMIFLVSNIFQCSSCSTILHGSIDRFSAHYMIKCEHRLQCAHYEI